jgi:hypothetical protein
MQPGHDTVDVMATHYGVTPAAVRDAIKSAGAEVIREDGYRGTLAMVAAGESGKKKIVGWSDGQAGFDPTTTKLTKSAILAVARWKIQQQEQQEETENGSDSES